MAGTEEEHEGASIQELLIEACRRNNTDLLNELLEGKEDSEIAQLLNTTTTVMGNHLYHEAASRGNYEIIDLLLDQPDFECDPVNRQEGDTPLHSAVRWINSEPPAQRDFGNALVDMMLEAGSNPRTRNKGGLTPIQLVDPRNEQLRDLIRRHEYMAMNAGDFVAAEDVAVVVRNNNNNKKDEKKKDKKKKEEVAVADGDEDDGEFSGSDEEERAEWERRQAKKKP